MLNVKRQLVLASGSPRRQEILKNAGYKPVVIPSCGEMSIIGKEYTRNIVCECAKVKATESYNVYLKSLIDNTYRDIDKTYEIKLNDQLIKYSMREVVDKNFGGDVEKYIDNLVRNMVIISADTVVANDGIIYGKPKDRDDAIWMLKSLSGKTHIVCTAICIGFYIDDVGSIKNDKNEKHLSNVIENDDKRRIVFLTKSEETKVTFRNLGDKAIEEYVDNMKPFDKAGAYGIQDENFSFVKNIDGNMDNVIGFPMQTFNSMLNEYNI